MKRVWVIALLSVSLFGDWCIQHAVQKRVYEEDRKFTRLFPKGVICKKDLLYYFLSGPYRNKEDLQAALKKARELHPDAFVKRCDSLRCKHFAFEKTASKKQRSIRYNAETSQEPIIVEGEKQTFQVNGSDRETNETILTIAEDSFVQNILKQLKESERGTAYTLTFQEFLQKLLSTDYGFKSQNFRQKAKRLTALLEQSSYDWQIYLNAIARYAKFIDYSLITNKELTVDGGINIDKRLFDGKYLYKDSVRYYKEQLAKIEYLTAKERLSLLGVEIYTQALLARELKNIYEKEYFNQKSFFYLIKERAKAGVASRVDIIDANNDLLELKKTLLQKIYGYVYSDYLLRNSIELNATGPLELENIGFALDEDDVSKLYERAYLKNSTIARERLLYGLKKAQVKIDESANLPIIDFRGALFYEYKKDYALTPHQKSSGLNYNVALNIKIPLFGGSSRSEYKERSKLEALEQKSRLLERVKVIAQKIYKLYSENRRLQQHLQILDKQLSLMRSKLQIVRKRYLDGLSPYRDFNNALRNFLRYIEEKAAIKTAMIRNSAQLNILVGHQISYGQN